MGRLIRKSEAFNPAIFDEKGELKYDVAEFVVNNMIVDEFVDTYNGQKGNQYDQELSASLQINLKGVMPKKQIEEEFETQLTQEDLQKIVEQLNNKKLHDVEAQLIELAAYYVKDYDFKQAFKDNGNIEYKFELQGEEIQLELEHDSDKEGYLAPPKY